MQRAIRQETVHSVERYCNEMCSRNDKQQLGFGCNLAVALSALGEVDTCRKSPCDAPTTTMSYRPSFLLLVRYNAMGQPDMEDTTYLAEDSMASPTGYESLPAPRVVIGYLTRRRYQASSHRNFGMLLGTLLLYLLIG
jgi:hypothetical protein